MEDLLNLHQPWDCERFPKSKTICYGGGGGGGGSVGNLGKVVEPSLKGLDLTKSTGALSPKGVKKITSTLKAAGDGSAFTAAVDKMNKETDKRLGIKQGVSSTIESVKSDIAKSDIGRGVSSTIESVKSDVARSDLGSGAMEEAVKRSDLGIISNQAKDVLNAPGAYIGKKAEEFKQYAKGQIFGGDKGGGDSGSSAASTSGQGPGQFATIGSGSQEGMRGTGTMKSGRQRARQNKRALRIASR
jgi:hypothetical protein